MAHPTASRGVGAPGEIYRYCPWDGHKFAESEICCAVCGSGRSFGSYEGHKRLEYLDTRSAHTTAVRWKKVLWEKSPFEDNYTDHTFLVGLRRNVHVKPYNYWALVKGSATITQQVATGAYKHTRTNNYCECLRGCATVQVASWWLLEVKLGVVGNGIDDVTLFIMLFYYTWLDFIGLPVLLTVQAVMLCAGYVVRTYTDKSFKGNVFVSSVRSLLLLLGTLVCLSPVLATLTNSFTNDTIFVLTIILVTLHLFTHDYAFDIGKSKRFAAPVSLNAIIFASVLLASRLSTAVHVFALIFLAIQLFALYPIMRHHVMKHSRPHYLKLTALMVATTAIMILPVSRFVSCAYVLFVAFVTFAGPFWLMSIQKYKNEIQGPWDEAVPSSGDYYRALR